VLAAAVLVAASLAVLPVLARPQDPPPQPADSAPQPQPPPAAQPQQPPPAAQPPPPPAAPPPSPPEAPPPQAPSPPPPPPAAPAPQAPPPAAPSPQAPPMPPPPPPSVPPQPSATLQPAASLPVSPPPTPAGNIPKTPIVLGALGGAFVLPGIALALGAKINANHAGTLSHSLAMMGGCPPANALTLSGQCLTLKTELNREAYWADGAVALWLVGGALGVSALTYVLWAHPSPTQPRAGVRVLPVMTGKGGGLFVEGAF
jgi:hypothetical protein